MSGDIGLHCLIDWAMWLVAMHQVRCYTMVEDRHIVVIVQVLPMERIVVA